MLNPTESRVYLRGASICYDMDDGSMRQMLRERLEQGRAEYGPLDLETDERDLRREAIEEAVDGVAYCAMLEERGEDVSRAMRHFALAWSLLRATVQETPPLAP